VLGRGEIRLAQDLPEHRASRLRVSGGQGRNGGSWSPATVRCHDSSRPDPIETDLAIVEELIATNRPWSQPSGATSSRRPDRR
jgi:hypothetical protein